MEPLITVLRWIHIMAGFTAFFVAPGALLTCKGGAAHRWWGKVFFWAMAVVASTAVIVAAYRPNFFLLLLAIFSFYLAFSGYRALFHKRPDKGQEPSWLDWSAAVLTLTVSTGLLLSGLFQPQWLHLPPIIALVLGVLGAILTGSDLRQFTRPFDYVTHSNAWFFAHLSKMLGSYIAAVSAFSVVNFTFLPPIVRWLWPTAVGVPAILLWVNHYQKKFRRGTATAEVATMRIRMKGREAS